jgi:hypothetical protein
VGVSRGWELDLDTALAQKFRETRFFTEDFGFQTPGFEFRGKTIDLNQAAIALPIPNFEF